MDSGGVLLLRNYFLNRYRIFVTIANLYLFIYCISHILMIELVINRHKW